ncbi:polysaccharide deacetylase family protein [Galbibacter sp.]|uniref:polysaccharide deacetylase family protein n=1 Tax=Galbibacter sp. TaxID=2918471 RepID=UPI003A8E35DD
MKLYVAKTPKLLKWVFKSKIWEVKTDKKEVFITFDDGPTLEVTDFVLDQLETHKAKASFFCIGKNMREHPEILNRIKADGHSIGNHTYNHYNCYKYSLEEYLKNIGLTAELIKEYEPSSKKLFRPPYGRISSKATKALQGQGYKIIMWDVLSADFDLRNTADQCVRNVIDNIKPGSIIVFHDSIKSYPVLKEVLPKVLNELKKTGYRCSAL